MNFPAIEWSENRYKAWCKNGLYHRDGDLPALIWQDGRRQWFQNGKLHRDPENDLPAVEEPGWVKKWYKNGKIHRGGGLPAIIQILDGLLEWYQNGECYNRLRVESSTLMKEIVNTNGRDTRVSTFKLKECSKVGK